MPATGHKPGILNHLSPIISWCNATVLLLSGDSKKTNKQTVGPGMSAAQD